MNDRDDIFRVIRAQVLDVLPDVAPDDVRIDGSLRDLGADSIDRAEIVQLSMHALKLKVPLIELAKVSNIAGLVDVFYQKSQSA